MRTVERDMLVTLTVIVLAPAAPAAVIDDDPWVG